MNCPICKGPMTIRYGKRGPFWGCNKYPKCKSTIHIVRIAFDPDCDGYHTDGRICSKCMGSYAAKEANGGTIERDTKRVWSHYQIDIFNEISDGVRALMAEAVAGSGKTTVLVEGLKLTPKDSEVAMIAFNKHIATELARRAPPHAHVSTYHSLGYGNIKSVAPKAEFKGNKVDMIVKAIAERQPSIDDYNVVMACKSSVLRLVSLLKDTLLPATVESVQYLSDRYNVEVNGDFGFIYNLVLQAFDKSNADILTVFDYDDMIYASAAGIVPCKKFDWIFADELQDLNRAQIVMTMKSMKDGGHIIAVGDRAQSIYGFRGADIDSIPNFLLETGAKTLPLSITYRCPKSHVELAKALVPQIEASETAKEGIIEDLTLDLFYQKVQVNDLVICRCNAPLVKPAFALISRGIKAVILGRDIGKNLLDMVDKVAKKAQVYNLPDVLSALKIYVESESEKLMAVGKSMMAQTMEDKLETIVALSDGLHTRAELEKRIQDVFSDEKEGVTFSTVHKAKGGEADRVFILNPELMPHPKASAEWELQQEMNIKYVALTRSKSELYFVTMPK